MFWKRVPTGTPNKIFYSSGDNQRVMVVDYATGGTTFRASKPHVWVEARLADFGKIRNFDVHPDGKRIVVVEAPDPEADRARNKAVVYLNLFAELRRVAPAHR